MRPSVRAIWCLAFVKAEDTHPRRKWYPCARVCSVIICAVRGPSLMVGSAHAGMGMIKLANKGVVVVHTSILILELRGWKPGICKAMHTTYRAS